MLKSQNPKDRQLRPRADRVGAVAQQPKTWRPQKGLPPRGTIPKGRLPARHVAAAHTTRTILEATT